MTRRSLCLSILSLASVALLVGPVAGQTSALPPEDKEGPPTIRIAPIKIDPNTPLRDLLPAAPKSTSNLAPLPADLRDVPEIGFGEPISRKLKFEDSVQQMAHIFAKVSHLNQQKRDGFLIALLDKRTDLQGLPFRMGDDCRTNEAQGRILPFLSATVNQAAQGFKNGHVSLDDFTDTLAELQTRPTLTTSKNIKVRVSRDNEESYYRALVSTLMQVLGPEPNKLRVRLARSLATIPHVDATRALAQLALFAPEADVRAVAIEGLRLRRDKDYTDILLQGFQYPFPEAAKRAAEALVKLERKDLVPSLVNELDRRDPRLPTVKTEKGKEVAVVRELVRVNHHHNCALCHAPANTADVPEWALKVPVPLPSEPFPSEGGYMRERSTPVPPAIFVRLDMTYLRQDFSLMMPVANASPWPALQRFDFFVRTRVLTPDEAQTWKAAAKDGPTPYQQSALLALRELTGRDAEPTAQAWRTMLKLQ